MRLGKPTMRFHVFPRSWQGYQDSCHWVVTTLQNRLIIATVEIFQIVLNTIQLMFQLSV